MEAAHTDGVPSSANARLDAGALVALCDAPSDVEVAAVLAEYASRQRWFGSKARAARRSGARLHDVIPLRCADRPACLAILRVDYRDGGGELFVLPLLLVKGALARDITRGHSWAVVARLQGGKGVLVDGLASEHFAKRLLLALSSPDVLDGSRSARLGVETFGALPDERQTRSLKARLVGVEQSNSSVVYSDQIMLKLFRRLHVGENPELEIQRHLARGQRRVQIPRLLAAATYHDDGEPATLAMTQMFIRNDGDGWKLWEHQLTGNLADLVARRALDGASADDIVPPSHADTLLGELVPLTRLLGRRTAELHHALADSAGDEAFAPVPFSVDDQRDASVAACTQLRAAWQLLMARQSSLSPDARALAHALQTRYDELEARLADLTKRPVRDARRIRGHGDLHLGQVLFAGGDFVFIDFEGEPARPLGERRVKTSPLRDVAALQRSIEYACHRALLTSAPPRELARLWSLAGAAAQRASQLLVDAYLDALRDDGDGEAAALLPNARGEVERLLAFYRLDKCVYELSYELDSRPTWVDIPLRGMLGELG